MENKTESNWHIFCRLRNSAKTVVRNVKRRLDSELFVGKSSKALWNNLRQVGVSDSSEHGIDCDANELNSYFLSHQLPEVVVEEISPELNRANEFSFRSVNFVELKVAFMKIKSGAVGHDRIRMKLLKLVFPIIGNILLYIVNNILTSSCFPDEWKVARVTTIRKSGSSDEFSNLRPISVLPILSKVVENIMKSQVMEHFDAFSLIDDCQSAYRKGHNTTSLLLSLTDSIRKHVSPSRFCIVLSLDSHC